MDKPFVCSWIKRGRFADYTIQLSPGLSFIDPTLAKLNFQFRLDCQEDCGDEPSGP